MTSDPPSRRLRGLGIGRGIAIGPALTMPDTGSTPALVRSDRTAYVEFSRARQALAATADEIRQRGERAGGAARDILEAQALMAEDPALSTDINRRTAEGRTAERAVHEAFAAYSDLLRGMGGYLGERAGDLDDVSARVVARLRGEPAPEVPESDQPYILVARDLSPADASILDLSLVLAVVTTEGGPTSHTAILARAKGLVTVVRAEGAEAIRDGELLVVDAAEGSVLVAPGPDEVDAAQEMKALREAERAAATGPGALADGTPVPLLANLSSASGAEEAIALGAEGVGLFRTEFLFLDSDEPLSVSAQQAEYVAVLEAFSGRRVVIRALDAGADKPFSFLAGESAENNPALGLRGLRTLRGHEQVLRDQLTALRNAAAVTRTQVWVMAPMVATVEEARYFTELCRDYGLSTAGVMVEVPSAALMADRILRVADFVSIGTNDLTQYTLAADRLLGSVAGLQDPWHPAVLRLIEQVGAAGRMTGKPVGVCGEAAADPLLAVVLVGLGVTALSMAPAALADVRAALRQFTMAQAREMAEKALSAESAPDARSAVVALVADL